MKLLQSCPPKLLINIILAWVIVTSMLYLLRPVTYNLPIWVTSMIEVPITVSLLHFWFGPIAMKLRQQCEVPAAPRSHYESRREAK